MQHKRTDDEVWTAIDQETRRQEEQLELIASENTASAEVIAAMGTSLTNKYAEGYPGRRYYGGCEHVDDVENIARGRLKRDAVFRDTALHFLRRFDALMARMARELGEDQMIAEIGDTRTGRAFMLIARVSGAFE